MRKTFIAIPQNPVGRLKNYLPVCSVVIMLSGFVTALIVNNLSSRLRSRFRQNLIPPITASGARMTVRCRAKDAEHIKKRKAELQHQASDAVRDQRDRAHRHLNLCQVQEYRTRHRLTVHEDAPESLSASTRRLNAGTRSCSNQVFR